MYQIDFNKPSRLYFIGIGGISMSGLAEILKGAGFTVSGSDSTPSNMTRHLEEAGIPVVIGQRAENITPDLDAVVYTAAIHPDNPELVRSQELGIPTLTRATVLGQIMKNYDNAITVAGTHGKTTTTSMASSVLLAAGTDPTITVGGILPAIGSNIRVGASGTFIAEACEYTNSFLEFFPRIAIILNVDADHLDFFKDLDDIAASFHRYAALVPSDGLLIMNKDSAKFETVTEGLTCPVTTYAIEDSSADYLAKDITYDEMGFGSFTCLEKGRELGRYSLGVPGLHNVSNALAVIALARHLGIADDFIRQGLSAFHGAKRRFERKGTLGGVTIVDDYAHHPTEVRAILTAALRCPHKRLYVAFQPHTYTRTKALLSEFAQALSLADQVLLADIYAAREKNTIGISSADLADAINAAGGHALYLPTFGEIEDHILTNCVDGDLLITMGAGNICNVGDDLLGLPSST